MRFNILLVLLLLSLSSYSQQLTEIPLTTNGYDNTAGVFDYLNGRLVVGGSGSFYSPQWTSTNGASLLISDDNGVTHVREDVNWQDNPFDHGALTAVEMVDGQTYLVGADHFNSFVRSIWRTTDAGNTWIEVHNDNSGDSPRWIYDIECSGNECLAVGTGNKVLRSTDGGQSWVELSPNVSTFSINEVVTVNGSDWFISTTEELIKYNLGVGFSTVYLPSRSVNRIVLNADQSFLLTAEDGWIYLSSDQGLNWDSTHVPTNRLILDAWSNGSSDLYAIDDDNKVFFSPSQGQYWYEMIADQDNLNQDLHFDNTSGIGFYSGGYKAYRIDSGFDNWIPIASQFEIPDTLCFGQSGNFSVVGSNAWSYSWMIDGVPTASGMNTTLSLDSIGYHQVQVNVSYNGQATTLSGSTYVTPSTALSVQPTLENDTLCSSEVGTILLPTDVGPTVYTFYSGGNQIGGPITVNGQDQEFVLPSNAITDVEVHAERSNPCQTETSVVSLTIYYSPEFQESDFLIPDFTCWNTPLEIDILSDVAGQFHIQQDNFNHNIQGTGDSIHVVLSNVFNGSDQITITAATYFGCSDVYGPYTVISPPLEAVAYVERNVVVDSAVVYYHHSIATYYNWSLPGSNIGTSLDENPIFSYPLPGTYPTQLVVSDDLGCTDTAYGQVTVHQQIDIMSGLDTCSVDTFEITTGGDSRTDYKYNQLVDKIVDSEGNTFFCGTFKERVYDIYLDGAVAPRMFVEKWDSSGNLVWRHADHDFQTSLWMTSITGMDIDPYGNVYVSGCYADPSSIIRPFRYPIYIPNEEEAYIAFVMKISPAGELTWFKLLPSDSYGYSDYSRATDILYENDSRILIPYLSDGSDAVICLDSSGSIVHRVPFSHSGYSGLQIGSYTNNAISGIYFTPKFRRSISGELMVQMYFTNDCGFDSSILTGGGFLEVELKPDLTWGVPNLILGGDVFPTSWSTDPSIIKLPPETFDEDGNRYISFHAQNGDFLLGGQNYSFGSACIGLAKLGPQGNLIWLHADTLNDLYQPGNEPAYVNHQEYYSDIEIVDGALFATGSYYRFARFTASNGTFAQFKGYGDRYGRFLNKYDLSGNLLWSKNLKTDNQEVSIELSKLPGCDQLDIYNQYVDLDTAMEEVVRVNFTKLSSDCGSSSNCSSLPYINMLSADRFGCLNDTMGLSAQLIGVFDSLRWHIYQNQEFTPLYSSPFYVGEDTDSITLFDVPSQFSPAVFRLTGYYFGQEFYSGAVQFSVEPEYPDANVLVNQSTCPDVLFNVIGVPSNIAVEVLMDGDYLTSWTGTYFYIDTVHVEHNFEFRYVHGCGYTYIDTIVNFVPHQVEITEQPVDITVLENANSASFSTGGVDIMAYQWQESEDNVSWTDMTDYFSSGSGINGSDAYYFSVLGSEIADRAGNYYRCLLINDIDCEGFTESAQLIVIPAGVEENGFDFGLSPNPNDGQFMISPMTKTNYSLELVDMLGRVLQRSNILGRTLVKTNVASGSYIIRLIDKQGFTISKRLSIQK